MPSPFMPVVRTFAIVLAALAAPSLAVAQQGGGAVLPPPSLYDDAPAPPSGAAPVARPAPAAPTRAEPAVTPQPAAAPSQSASMPAASRQPTQSAERRPWYRWLWPFGGNGAKQERVAESQAAPVAQPAPVALPTPGRGGGEFAFDTPNRVIRSGLFGDCVKTGAWNGPDGGECPGATVAPAPVAIVEPTPTRAAARRVEPEPVQVQPLMPEPAQQPTPIETVPEPVTAPAPPPPPPPAPMTQTTTLGADALFAIGSFQLRPSAKAKLDELAAQLDQFDYERILITGHTDPTGSASLNERLSRQRAESVKRYLVTKGLPADKIETEGMGSSMPFVTDKDCSRLSRTQMIACYQPDRRVEIEVTGVMMVTR